MKQAILQKSKETARWHVYIISTKIINLIKEGGSGASLREQLQELSDEMSDAPEIVDLIAQIF